ncbi:hypothetical protein HK105_203125 [Polyrhizophydium stewartii]|uniref:Nudix hydrolase domain-containing protein n=1 Tax=Polyrhizophydium stewartii TaxID=2732419 RepID=A0ABR4NDA2_9FUNG|nr:nudix (nucleoside diphosphate linked moiety X)-type motif 8 [Polyrhizophydium stewartii]
MPLAFDPRSIRFDAETLAGYAALLAEGGVTVGPGSVQQRMRWKWRPHPSRGEVDEAAVLLPLMVAGGEPSVLFTVRASSLRSHSGEVAFPGGRRDAADASLVDTALREAREETGIPADAVTVLGTQTPAPNHRQTTRVTPVIGFVDLAAIASRHASSPSAPSPSPPSSPGSSSAPSQPDPLGMLTLSPDEVAGAFTVPMWHLLDPSRRLVEDFRTMGIRVSNWTVGEHVIWGLSALMLDHFLNSVVVPYHARLAPHIAAAPA